MQKNLKVSRKRRQSSKEEFFSLMEIENYFTPRAFKRQISDHTKKEQGAITMINVLSHLD